MLCTTAMEKRTRMTPKRVGVPEIDQAFADVAETFNQQQEHYKTMTECLTALRGRYRCSHGDGLSVCMRNMRDEYSEYPADVRLSLSISCLSACCVGVLTKQTAVPITLLEVAPMHGPTAKFTTVYHPGWQILPSAP